MEDKPLKVCFYCRLSNEPEKATDIKYEKLQQRLNQKIKKLYYPYYNNYISKLNFDGKQRGCL